jgi:alpha-L-fucosidase
MSTSDSSNGAAAQHAALGLDTKAAQVLTTSHPGAQWFPRAGLGLMIHWGLSSVHGGIDLSWGMLANTPWDASGAPANKITPREYWKLADRFQPVRYDPEPWIAAAARAGFKYAVFVAMHHDGYTLWPSAHSDFGVHTHLGGRDLVAPFVDACKRHGLKVGLYLSPPDWHFDREVMSFNYPSLGGLDRKRPVTGIPRFDQDHAPADVPDPSPEQDARRRAAFHGRIQELLTRYGRVDLLWFDGGTHDNAARDLALRLQPHLVINSRSCDGHFGSSECHLPETPPTGWFETVHCWQSCDLLTPRGTNVDVWGYLKTETFKSARWAHDAHRRLKAWNANFLINVAPRPDGEMPPVVLERLEEFRLLNLEHASTPRT